MDTYILFIEPLIYVCIYFRFWHFESSIQEPVAEVGVSHMYRS